MALTAAVTVGGLKWAGADFSPLAGNPAYKQFVDVYGLLSQDYYRSVNSNELIVGAIHGMVDSLGDPFSLYMNPVMAARFREMVTSQFHGIGAVIAVSGGQLVISSVLPGSPAQRSGIRAGDAILKINGVQTANMSVERAVELVRGRVGTPVTLELARGDERIVVRPVRARVHQSTVFARMLQDRIGYLLITQFGPDTAAAFRRDLDILKSRGARALVVDVRQDPGGLLQSVTQVASALLPKGATVAQIALRGGRRQVIRSTGPGVALPLVCLIDQGSASAAEVLAAALSQSGGAALIGERSYGKGTVQETEEFSDGSSLKMTVARWLTPAGQWVHRLGLAPRIAVPTPSFFHLPPLPMTSRRLLEQNSNSVSVAVLQRMLLALGFDPGRTDGYFGTATSQAVAAFQRLHRLPVTGKVDAATAYVLNVAILARRERTDPQLTAAVGYLENRLGAT